MRPAILCTLAFSTLVAACGSDTARSRVNFRVSAQALPHDGPLVTETGWTVELSEARLHLEGLYFFEGEPLFSRVDRRPWPQRLGDLVVGTAYAHPGHYVEGEALADLLQPVTLDLLAGPTELGQAHGVSGAYNSARVVLSPNPELGDQAVRILGRATKNGVTVQFRGALTLEQPIEGVAFGQDIEASDGQVRLEIDLGEWVRRIDFGTLPTGAEVELSPDTQAHNAFSRGVNNTTAFHFTWIPG